MNFDFAHVIAIILLLVVFTTAALSDRKNFLENPNSCFPVNQKITLVYESFFDEYVTNYFRDGEYSYQKGEEKTETNNNKDKPNGLKINS